MGDIINDPVTLTPAAREKASEYLKQDKAREVFRVSFDDKGKLSVELDKLRAGDRTFAQGDINIAMAEPLVSLLRGLTIDFGPNTEGKVGFSFSGPPTGDADLGNKAKQALAHHGAGAAHGHGDGEHSSELDYLKIFFALGFLTAVELGCVFLPISKVAIIILLVTLAFVKAALVGMYFMHLKFEGRWKHVLLVPPVILAIVLIFALFPDVGGTGAWPADRPSGSIAATEK
jgi:caa(3)-type oxidase subunit IV